MKASFGKRDIPVFLSLASQYAPKNIIEPARTALRLFAFGYNQGVVYTDCADRHILAISSLLNIIVQNLALKESCYFFEINQIEFSGISSYKHAFTKLKEFEASNLRPYNDEILRFLSEDLTHISRVISVCEGLLKPRNERPALDKEAKKPVIKDIGSYPYLLDSVSRSAVLKHKKNDPVLNAHRILAKSLRFDSITEEELNAVHGYLETMLINGWDYYYRQIKITYSTVEHNIRYTSILKKLESVGNNIINVSLIGRHNRQIAAIDIKHSFDNEAHRKMMFELQGFISNVFCFFLAYNYLSHRIEKSAASLEPENTVFYTWTCGYCNKKFGNSKAVVIDHNITITDANGAPRKTICPGKKHPPLEIDDSGLRIKAESERTRYEHAVLELRALDTATSLMVVGKHSNRIFTPKDMSWNDRLNKAKAEKKATVDQLKSVYEKFKKELAAWKPTSTEQLTVWTSSKKKIA
ncbi:MULTISPECIES: hypothetical protein [Acinetobacter]|uniref:Uncharacterized protein n=1 Tax=Acinetobacter indicus TaxID=756892 RepID=A0A6C0Y6B4_9GAMM|nr:MULTISPECIES: hypothetical protein [Acinetobacter]QIC71764.1 hypothetical protein FSC09_15340 [Acinetobacter indicus]QKQ71672.1 hypothetical protein E5Y90_15700 [Acinetobacter sp. 10FS3-1]